MYSTTAYLYQQRTQVLLIDTDGCGCYLTARYNPVYAKKLTINKGVDNVLLFSMVNQDEKPVNVTGSSFMFRLLDTAGIKVLLEAPMTILNAQTGQIKVTIPTSSLLEVPAQPASYSIAVSSGNLTQAVFTNAQSGARAPVDVVNSVLPMHVPSAPLTIPTTDVTSQLSIDGSQYQNYPNWAGQYGGSPGWINFYYTNTEFYSSFIEPKNSVTTIQMTLVGYTGTIKVQAAENYQSLWYNVTDSQTFYNETRTIYLNVVGWHPLLRVCFNNSIYSTPTPPGYPASAYAVCVDGELSTITIQNGGSGYLAPPKIDIVGDGSRAAARAIMSNTYPPGHPQAGIGYGSVESIEVTNPGSGYWPVPGGGVNSANYPVPPANQGALVVINTGFVVDLLYR